MAMTKSNAAEEAKRLRGELQKRGARLEEAEAALRSAELRCCFAYVCQMRAGLCLYEVVRLVYRYFFLTSE